MIAVSYADMQPDRQQCSNTHECYMHTHNMHRYTHSTNICRRPDRFTPGQTCMQSCMQAYMQTDPDMPADIRAHTRHTIHTYIQSDSKNGRRAYRYAAMKTDSQPYIQTAGRADSAACIPPFIHTDAHRRACGRPGRHTRTHTVMQTTRNRHDYTQSDRHTRIHNVLR